MNGIASAKRLGLYCAGESGHGPKGDPPMSSPDGRERLDQVPLTLEDVLHPQEEDVIPENSLHEKERGDLARIFRTRLSRLRSGLVLSDCLIDWNVRGMGTHAPDISIF